LRILYFSSGSSVHDDQFLKKFSTSRHTFCFASMHVHPLSVPAGIPYHYLGGDERRLPGQAGRALAAVQMFRRVRDLVRTWKPDLIHAGPANTAGAIAAAIGFRPLLLMPWGTDILIVPRQSLFGRLIVRRTINRADLITCDARVVRDRIVELTGYPPDKIVVFPWGIDLERFEPRESARQTARAALGLTEGPVILMNRAHKPVYGIEFFLRALPRVLARVPEATAVIAGDGPLRESLISLARELGLSSRARFVGAVDNPSMPSLLHASNVYVSSSLSDGTSVSLLEAMACGLPVVVSDLPSNREWVEPERGGLLVPPRDVDSLADAMVRVLTDHELSRAMGRRNLEIARERADWNRNYAMLEEMYDTLGSRLQQGALSA